MRRLSVIIAAALLVCLCGCAPRGVKPLDAGVLTEPVTDARGTGARAYIDVLDYAVKDFVNRAENRDRKIDFIRCSLASSKFLTSGEREEVERFLSSYGIALRTDNRELSIEEQQRGLELTVVENPSTEFYVENTDMVLQVKAYLGSGGRGYFGSFRSHGKGYVLVNVYDNVVYSR